MKMTQKESFGFTVLALLMPCLLLCLEAGGTTLQPTASELQPLQGTWEGFFVGQESDGKITVTITGNSLHFHRDAKFWFETTFTLTVGTDPQQLVATIRRCSPPEDSIGKVVEAIFKIEEGTLFLAELPNNLEPPNFEALADKGQSRYELRKVQPQNAPEPSKKLESQRSTGNRK